MKRAVDQDLRERADGGPHDQADQILHRYNDVKDPERAVREAGGDLTALQAGMVPIAALFLAGILIPVFVRGGARPIGEAHPLQEKDAA